MTMPFGRKYDKLYLCPAYILDLKPVEWHDLQIWETVGLHLITNLYQVMVYLISHLQNELDCSICRYANSYGSRLLGVIVHSVQRP